MVTPLCVSMASYYVKYSTNGSSFQDSDLGVSIVGSEGRVERVLAMAECLESMSVAKFFTLERNDGVARASSWRETRL